MSAPECLCPDRRVVTASLHALEFQALAGQAGYTQKLCIVGNELRLKAQGCGRNDRVWQLAAEQIKYRVGIENSLQDHSFRTRAW